MAGTPYHTGPWAVSNTSLRRDLHCFSNKKRGISCYRRPIAGPTRLSDSVTRWAVGAGSGSLNAVCPPQPGQKVHIYRQWIKKATEHFGVTSTREIFEQAVEQLPEKVCGRNGTFSILGPIFLEWVQSYSGQRKHSAKAMSS